MSVAINIDNVVKKYGDLTVINGLSLKIKPGEFFTLLGPSGCGKTTLLRMIIGFNSIEGGTISLDDKVINDIPTHLRNMGMVFQNYAIFPHMSVAENVAFGLKNRKWPKNEIDSIVKEALEIVKIYHLKDRMPAALSGGQQQRVALARAVVISPDVLLMDETLSNLDAKLRVEMRNAIKWLQSNYGITTVYVTHDQEEALSVSDRIAVMNEGIIQQIGSPKKIYQRPYNKFVSNFIGLSNFFEGSLEEKNISVGTYSISMDNLSSEAKENKDILVAVRPEEFIIASEKEPGIKAKVLSSVFLGVTTHYFMESEAGQNLEVIQPSDNADIIPNGTTVSLQFDAKKINIFNREGSKSLIDGVIAYEE